MWSTRRIPSSLWVAALGVAVSTRGLAAPADRAMPSPAEQRATPEASIESPVEQAREAFRRGAALAKAEHWQDAIASFEQSYALKPHPVTSYDIGFCERALQHDTRARKMFKRAFDEHRAGTEGSLPDDLIALGKHYLDELEGRLARAEVVVDSPDALVLVDGAPLETESGRAPAGLPLVVAGTRSAGPPERVPAERFLVLLDPGAHTFNFSYPGLPETVSTETFAPGSRLLVEHAIRSATRKQPAPAPMLATPRSPRHTWAYVALSAGAVGLVAGSVSGALALHKRSELDEDCGVNHKACPNRDGIETLNNFADISTVGFTLAAVGVGVGLGLYLWGPASSKPAQAARVMFDVEPGFVGLSGEF